MMPAVTRHLRGRRGHHDAAESVPAEGHEAGETRNFAQKVSVNYLDDPTDQRYSGSLDGHLHLLWARTR